MQWLEGINAVTVIFAALCVFAIGYRFYGLYIAQKVLNLNPNRETPAVKYADDRDYVKPTNSFCSVTTLPRLQRPVPCSDRCLPRSSGTCPGFSGF